MSTRVISMALDGINKSFTVPNQPRPLELDVCFNELKEAWLKQQKRQQKNAPKSDQR